MGEALRSRQFDAEDIGVATPETDTNGHVSLYRANITHYPFQLAVQVGDFINELRASLDHIATGFVEGGQRGQSRNAGFPILLSLIHI